MSDDEHVTLMETQPEASSQRLGGQVQNLHHVSSARFNRPLAAVFGAIQMFCGFAMIIFGIITIFQEANTVYEGSPIIFGIFFGVVGAVGCIAGYKRTDATISSSMTLSIVAAVMCAGLIVVAVLDLVNENKKNGNQGKNVTREFINDNINASAHEVASTVSPGTHNTREALNIVILCLSVVEGVIAVFNAIFGCKAVCPCEVCQ
ncbi:membrane-spanning 4-domains subfamily A member 4D-like [Ptychodera flava]|uniref:membrane-spanning 4-domains subfamily A member 4D-like n=1 Tax=Ptychodera flava TaxID=63121 RepID=UPI003969E401